MDNIIKNKRGWVKNAAIIFLSVMLVLTFFSNTILNWSLPEVSGQYAGYGQIKTAVTGSGTVTALQNYKVTVDEPRTIESVLVREGDMVQEGDVLFVLEEYENEELKNAEKALEDMEYSYQVKMLGRNDTEYSDDLEEIKELEQKLSELKEDRVKADKHEQNVKGNEEIIKIYENEVDKYTQLVSELEERYSLLTSGDSANSEEIAAKIAELEAAEKELEAAKENYDNRKEEYDEIAEDVDIPYSSAESAYNSAYEAYTSAYQQLQYLQQDYNALLNANSKYSAAKKELEAAEKVLAEKSEALEKAKEALKNASDEDKAQLESKVQEAQKQYDSADSDVKAYKEYLADLDSVSSSELTAAERELKRQQDNVNELSRNLSKAKTELATARNDKNDLDDAKEKLDAAEQVLKNVQKKTDALQKELDDLLSSEAKIVKERIKTEKATLKAVNAKLSEEKNKLANIMDEDISSTDAIDTEIENLEKQIQKAKDDAEKQKDDRYKDDALFALEINRDKKAIEEQKQKIEKLKEKTFTNEVKSKNSGTVAALNVYAGLDVTPNEILAEIELSGSGYVLEIPVTLEQSQKIRVGDKVNVTNYYWGDNISMSVKEIRADRTKPNGGRTVVISVEGDLNYGKTFEVSIGERTKSYDLVVPNNAIREDANGKYILIASVRNTPLGNRYIAKRVDVTVVDKDNVNSAVDTTSEYNYEYVITSSTAPIADGSQVRLVES